jgi:hypothetical protein
MPLGGASKTGIITLPVGGGIVADEVSHELPENVCTDGLNVRFRDGYVSRTEGYDEALTAPSAAALHIASLQTPEANYWVHATGAGLFADDGTTKTTITGTAFTGSDKITSTVLGGVLVINNGVDIPQYWGGTGVAANLTAWATTDRCKSLRAFKNYLIAVNVTKSGTNYGSMVKWSHAAAPGFLPDSWDISDPTKDAGELDVAQTDDDCVDSLELANTHIVYKERSAYGMQYLANNSIFRVFRLPGSYGVMSQNCVASIPNGHVLLTNDPDVVMHYANEPRSILQGKWRRWLEANIDTATFRNSFVFANYPRAEVWICIPATGSTYANRALVWNWEQDTITLVAIPNLTHAVMGRYLRGGVTWAADTGTWATDDGPWDDFDVANRILASSGDSKIYLIDEGETFDGGSIAATFSRVGLSFGDPEMTKLLRGAVLRVDGTAGTVLSVEGAFANDVEGPYTYTTPVSYTVGTTRRADFMCTGRFVGIRVSSTGTGDWRVKSVGYDVKLGGAY